MRRTHLPSITELEVFTACARHGTTVQAARHLNLTQSAVSRSLAALEDRLGVRLFDRVRRRLALSDAGRALLDRAEPLLADLSEASAGVMAFAGQTAVLRIAVLPSFGRGWLVPRLARFAAAHPGTTFDIAARLTPPDFDRDPFDLAIMRSAHQSPGAEVIPLLPERLVVVAAPALLGNIPPDLLTLPLLQQSTRPTLWLDWFREIGADPRLALRGARFDHFDMVIDAAMSGLGAAIVPEILAAPALAEGRLALASPRRLDTGEAYALFLPEKARTLPRLLAFRDWLLAELGP